MEEVINMSRYIVLSKLTDEGRRTLKNNPQRIVEVNKEMETMGVKVVLQYALLGKYDFLTLLDAPDHKSISKVIGEMNSRGTVDTLTMPAMPVKEFLESLEN